MKRIALTIAILLGICFAAKAQQGGGLFQYGEVSDQDYYYGSVWYALDQNNDFQRNSLLLPGLPNHGETDNMDAPLGGGALLFIGFGAVYALKKRKD